MTINSGLYRILIIGLIYHAILFLCSCKENSDKTVLESKKQLAKQETLNLSDTLLIKEDLSISYLKIDSLTLSNFNILDQMKFEKSETGGLSCGESVSIWSANTEFTNDSIGLTLEFSSSWMDYEERKEQILSKIIFNHSKAKFHNDITIGRSSLYETETKFGVPNKQSENMLDYTINNTQVSFYFNEQKTLTHIYLNHTNTP